MICWNSAGLRASTVTTQEKMGFFNSQFPNGDFALAAFIETHHKTEEEIPDTIKEYKVTHHLIHTPTGAGQTHKGIIVLLNKCYDILDT